MNTCAGVVSALKQPERGGWHFLYLALCFLQCGCWHLSSVHARSEGVHAENPRAQPNKHIALMQQLAFPYPLLRLARKTCTCFKWCAVIRNQALHD